MESRHRHIRNRLRMHRRMHRLRQRDVARILGLQSTAQLSQWENGLAMPGGVQLIKLGILYGTFPNELYFEYYQELKAEIKARQHELSDTIL